MGVKITYYAVSDAFTPTECLRQAIEAERMGFDYIAVEDHFAPMPGSVLCNFGWTIMSSALQATERVPFMTAVTAPIMRYNPAVVAQAFATMGAMYPGRVRIGVGTGEELNEMAVCGGEWPSPGTRLDMLEEAVTIMNRLWTSTEPVSFAGKYYTLNNAIVWTKPEEKIPVYFSAVGPRAAKLAGRLGDHLITVANAPQYVKEVLMPNFEAGAKEAGKDPKTMERAVNIDYWYDPDQLINLIPPEYQKYEAGTVPGMETKLTGFLFFFHSAEDIIKKIEELKGIGFDNIVVSNVTSNASLRRIIETLRQSSAIPTATLDRLSHATVDEAASLKIWEDIFPHVR